MKVPEAEFRVVKCSPSYEVSEWGDVRRIGKAACLRPCVLKRGGYLAVSLWENGKGRLFRVNRLVAIAFRGDPPSPKYDAAHDDGNKLNNHKSNIHWKTRAENEADKVLHGTSNRGERNGMAKISDKEAEEIRKEVRADPRRGIYRAVAQYHGLSETAVWNIANGKRRAV